ncbi:SpoIIE family protein phosphatase [Peptococcus simiae]|uniref:Stage 0 sporulation protein A homolog n=1 Tax=Peptococcus simiae TaxID=1643805 RepID=A0ABW9GXF3_9FIRM
MSDQSSVLIIDDYAVNIELLESYLMTSNFNLNIYKATSGLEAMQIFNSKELDLVITDVMLPDINGFELCRMMKDLRQENFLPVVMVTALTDRSHRLHGLASGADDFLTKPVSGDELLIRVGNLLRLRKATVDLNARYTEISQDLKLARQLLNDFMPKGTPFGGALKVDLIYQPANFVGGDFYDFLQVDDDTYGFFIADVKGHGASAAIIVAILKEKLYELKDYWADPAQLFDQINGNLWRFFSNTRNDFFVTACYLLYNKEKKDVLWANAGHVPPVLFKESRIETLDLVSSLPLGLFEDASFENGRYACAADEALLLYTDGIFELPIFGRPSRYYSDIASIYEADLVDLYAPPAFMTEVRSALRQFSQNDDVNIILVSL